MQTVFDNDMCAHVWAQQSQPNGRGSKGSVFFEGGALYSYGSHFLTGFIINGVALLNLDRYSITTRKHQSQAASAVGHLTRYHVPALTELRDVLRLIKPTVESGGRVARDSWQRRDVIKWLEKHADVLSDGDNDNGWKGDPRPSAVFIGGLVGMTEKQVAATLDRGRREIAKRRAAAKAEQVRRRAEEARQVADMSDNEFDAWTERDWYVRPPQSVGDERAFAANREHAKRLFRLHRDAKACRIGSKRVAKLAERLKAHRARLASYDADLAEAIAARHAERFANWAARWTTARTDDQRFQVMSTNGVRSSDYGEGTAERAELEAAESWYQAETIRRKAEAEREQRERDREAFEAWRAGEDVRLPYIWTRDPAGRAYIRRKGDWLQTSQGAEVPWAHAVKAFRFIKLCRERGEGFRSNGRVIRVGHFTVAEITPAGDMRAGCHSFAWAEIERLAKSEGVYDDTPSAEAVEVRQGAH